MNKFTILEEFKKPIIVKSQNNRTYMKTFYKVQCECGTILIKNKEQLKATTSCKKCSFKIHEHFDSHQTNLISKSLLNTYKKGAIKRNIEFLVDADYLTLLYNQQDQKCALSGQPLIIKDRYKNLFKGRTASLDRIDSSKGYVEGNLQWVHKDLNRMKNAYSQEEFINWCKLITEYQNK